LERRKNHTTSQRSSPKSHRSHHQTSQTRPRPLRPTTLFLPTLHINKPQPRSL
jgi:hypothetical protein